MNSTVTVRAMIAVAVVSAGRGLAGARLSVASGAGVVNAGRGGAGSPRRLRTLPGRQPRGTVSICGELGVDKHTGESHQMLMDTSCIVLSLARHDDGEAALEAFELLRLERERTGRPGDLPAAMVWVQEAVTSAREHVDPEAAQAAATHARRHQPSHPRDRSGEQCALSVDVPAVTQPTRQRGPAARPLRQTQRVTSRNGPSLSLCEGKQTGRTIWCPLRTCARTGL